MFPCSVAEFDVADEGAAFFQFEFDVFVAVDVFVFYENGHLLEALVDGWHGAAVFVMVHCEMCAMESSPVGCVGLARCCGGEITHVVGEGAIVEGHLAGNEMRSTHGEKKVFQSQFDLRACRKKNVESLRQ